MAPVYISAPPQVLVVPSAEPDDRRPFYVCVSGVTAAGKSTAMRLVSDQLAQRRANVAVIDERALHQYLDRLFTDPDGFGLELQLEFMVDRALLVKRWLMAGHSLVMERSHLEDPVFIRHLLEFGHVTDAEHDAYMAVWAALDARLPRPDLLLLIDVSAAISMDRLSRDDGSGGRPPFADETVQRVVGDVVAQALPSAIAKVGAVRGDAEESCRMLWPSLCRNGYRYCYFTPLRLHYGTAGKFDVDYSQSPDHGKPGTVPIPTAPSALSHQDDLV